MSDEMLTRMLTQTFTPPAGMSASTAADLAAAAVTDARRRPFTGGQAVAADEVLTSVSTKTRSRS